MKIPGWVAALLAVALLGAAMVWVVFAFVANTMQDLVGAGVLGIIALWVMVRAAASSAPVSGPINRASFVAVEVPPTVCLGAEFSVRARLQLNAPLKLNPHRQRLRFVIEEKWFSTGDEVEPSAIVHEEIQQVHVPVDLVGEWETTWSARVPLDAPTSIQGKWFQLHAWVEFSLPHGMFSELKATQPVIIVPEVAP